MPWQLFEQRARAYEIWYRTRRGRLVSECERALLRRLLARFPHARSVLEIGSGTGHFAAWLIQEGWTAIGLDRAPAMLHASRATHPELPLVLGDGHRLPVGRNAVDLCLFVTTLEFLDDPHVALREAAAVARRGIIIVALNRWSTGGLSRRFGAQAKRPILGQARDYSLPELHALLRNALSPCLQHIWWSSTLFPRPGQRLHMRIPLGDVLGIAVPAGM